MKKFVKLFFTLVLIQGTAFSQSDTINDTLLISEAMQKIEKARKLTTSGIVFGSLAYFTVLYNAGVAAGNEYGTDEGVMTLIGISAGTTRMILSFATPKHLRKAEKMLVQVQMEASDDSMFEGSLRHLRIAKNASIVVPVFGITAMGLVAASMVMSATEGSGQGLWITGFLFATASFTSTIVSSVHISKAKKMLRNETRSLDLGMNSTGIGIVYHF